MSPSAESESGPPPREAAAAPADGDARFAELEVRLAEAEAQVARLGAQRDDAADEAERLRGAVGLLGDLTLVVPLSDDPQPWLQRIARLLVPRVADGCLFEVLVGDRLIPLAAAHTQAAKAEALLRGDPTELLHVFKGAALRAPLAVRGERLGFLTAWADGDRSLGPTEHALIDWVARHVAAQLENARLYSTAERDARQRDEFIAMAAHELRTPLQALGMGLDLVQSRLSATADELPRAWLDARIGRTRQQVSRLKQLVDSLLNVNEIQSGALELRPERCDIAEIVRELAARAEDELRWAGCVLTTELEAAAGRWDRLRVELIVSNLLGNAIKYGAGKPVRIAVRAEGASVRLVVRDEGPGIAPEDQERIFGRFERLSGGARTSGFGLGLWIVRELAGAMGGSVRVDSAPGRGSAFIVELPLAPG